MRNLPLWIAATNRREDITVSPSVLALTITLAVPVINTGGSVAVQPLALALTLSMLSPTIAGVILISNIATNRRVVAAGNNQIWYEDV